MSFNINHGGGVTTLPDIPTEILEKYLYHVIVPVYSDGSICYALYSTQYELNYLPAYMTGTQFNTLIEFEGVGYAIYEYNGTTYTEWTNTIEEAETNAMIQIEGPFLNDGTTDTNGDVIWSNYDIKSVISTDSSFNFIYGDIYFLKSIQFAERYKLPSTWFKDIAKQVRNLTGFVKRYNIYEMNDCLTKLSPRFSNGTEWSPNVPTKIVQCIKSAMGLVLIGANSSDSGIYYSTDNGKNIWIKTNYTEDCYSIECANGILVAGGVGLWYSTDGITWTQSNITEGQFETLFYSNKIWIAACADFSNNGLWYSEDGKTWTQSNITTGNFGTVEYGIGLFIAGNSAGKDSSTSETLSGTGLYYSTNGKTWTQSNITTGSINKVKYENTGIYVAAGVANTYYSTDGKTWTKSNLTALSDNVTSIMDLVHAKGMWVGCSGTNDGIWYSTDGMTWNQGNQTTGEFWYVKYNAGIFIAGVMLASSGTESGIYYSTDGITWTQSNITDGLIYCIENINGIWLAGTNNGLYRSVTWEPTI